jgi:hypothetical protein
MLRPDMEAFKENKILQCQKGFVVPQSFLLSTDGITEFFCSLSFQFVTSSLGVARLWLLTMEVLLLPSSLDGSWLATNLPCWSSLYSLRSNCIENITLPISGSFI